MNAIKFLAAFVGGAAASYVVLLALLWLRMGPLSVIGSWGLLVLLTIRSVVLILAVLRLILPRSEVLAAGAVVGCVSFFIFDGWLTIAAALIQQEIS